MRVYLAGKITGNPDYKEQFAAAETFHRMNGFNDIFNPAADQPEGLTYKEYLDRDLKELMKCDAAFFLPNWEESKGAKIEMAYAKAAGLPIFILDWVTLNKYMKLEEDKT